MKFNVNNVFLFDLKQAVVNQEMIDEKIREYFYPKLYKLIKSGCTVKYPNHKKKDDWMTISEYGIQDNGNIYVCFDVHWGGDVYDSDSFSMSSQQWDLI